MPLPTVQQVMNMYWYGQYSPNPNAPLRPDNAVSTISISVTEYMQEAGWFAVPAQFNVVKDFFNAPVGTFQIGRDYTFIEVKTILESNNPSKNYTNLWDAQQYEWDNTTSGAAGIFERTMIYNSVQFKLGDTTKFSVDSSGNLSLKNWNVIPDKDENFDFESNDGLAKLLNPALEAVLDPNGIGRKVNIEFIPDTSPNPTAYTQSNFNNDLNVNIPSWYIPTSSNSAINDFLEAIKNLSDDYGWLLDNLDPNSPWFNPAAPNSPWINPNDPNSPWFNPSFPDLGKLLPSWLTPVGGLFNDIPAIPIMGRAGDPLVLDLDGDGVEVSRLGYGVGASTVYFDMDNDGFAERTAWATGGDGLLTLDKNGNGTIDNQDELFGF